MNEIKRFIEGQKYSIEEIPKVYIEKQYFKKNNFGTFTLKVCGLTNYENVTYVFYPKGYNIKKSSDKLNEDAINLFHSIIKYKNEVTLSEEETVWLGDDQTNVYTFRHIEWLIQDYIKNGLYFKQKIHNKINGSGKILWGKTIKSQTPVIQNNQLIYLNCITRYNNINNKDIVTLIHNNILYEVISRFGWLFKVQLPIEVTDLNLSTENQILDLKKRLTETYVDRDIRLLKTLISLLSLKKSTDINLNFITPYYYSIWEEMLKVISGHKKKLQNLLPKPYWIINGTKKFTKQIPDILIENDDSLLIIDAKYYSIYSREVKEFPGWESIVKQLYYLKSLEKKYKYIQNVFLFPKSLEVETIKYLAKTSVQEMEVDFKFIYAFFIDISYVLKKYVKDSYDNRIAKFIYKWVRNFDEETFGQ